MDTNCFEIRQDGLNLRAMYRIACLISHDCTPNTRHTFGKGLDLNLYATTDIGKLGRISHDNKNNLLRSFAFSSLADKDSVISASYTQSLWNTPQRREHLRMSKCFWCACDRCRDPSEFGTWLTCSICPECGGRVAMQDPLEIDADWK